MFNKRGQGLSINAIILIILAVLVLVFVVIGFTVGWSKVLPFIKPANNVKDVANKCEVACSTESAYDFCVSSRDVKVEQEIESLGTAFSGNCYELSTVSELGINSCGSLCGDTGIKHAEYCTTPKEWNDNTKRCVDKSAEIG